MVKECWFPKIILDDSTKQRFIYLEKGNSSWGGAEATLFDSYEEGITVLNAWLLVKFSKEYLQLNKESIITPNLAKYIKNIITDSEEMYNIKLLRDFLDRIINS